MTTATPAETDSAFFRVKFIMVQPSHPGNVGAAARAIKTMGFHHLCLVAPRFADVLDRPEAQALASGATDVLASVNIVDTLAQALAHCTLSFALTARARMLGPPACDIRVAANISRVHLQEHPEGQIAIILGTERSGLTNEDIGLCNRICHIPANPEYSSLNVAQALQLAAWELRYALAIAESLPLLPDNHGRAQAGDELAAAEKVQALIHHWEQALIAVQFLDPLHPKKLVPRMHHWLNRSALSNDEVDMLRGLCTAMIKTSKRQ
jgi:tRNA/rRNA methyltransferase